MIQKYRKITTQILAIVLLLIGLLFADSYVLPQKTIEDKIESYSSIYITHHNKYSASETKTFLGYLYFTQKGYTFSTQKIYIEENNVTLKQSYITKNITSVKTKTSDYSKKLMSGLNGAILYITIGLVISLIISLTLLMFDKNLTENEFLNIIIFNSFWAFIALYLSLTYS
jgi:uncharacterized protein YacL